MGDDKPGEHRNSARILQLLKWQKDGLAIPSFVEMGLRDGVYKPFWEDLPYCDIFECMTPDILHQLHKGVFKDHLVDWCTKIAGEKEIDDRFHRMTPHSGLRYFKNGISSISQWTGTEHKEMEKVLLGILVGAVQVRVQNVARALLSFIYYAQLQQHTSSTLKKMQSALDEFHINKDVVIELEIRDAMNIPKFHSMLHYIQMIRSHGTADGFNSELSERLHIDYAKLAYRASNKKDYTAQMAIWLRRRESIHLFDAYLRWVDNKSKSVVLPEGSDDSDSDEKILDSIGRRDHCEGLSLSFSALINANSILRYIQPPAHPPTRQNRLTQVQLRHHPRTRLLYEVPFRSKDSMPLPTNMVSLIFQTGSTNF